MVTVDLSVRVEMEHRRAASACHGALLALPTADELASGVFDDTPEGERFTCTQCAQPTARVLADPVTVVAGNG